ncbi:Copia protein [Habropoda laboriosa]|uniref:Copia protein n=1 Tax=Habropoda laboriosa TaxID=597456 RepID=A0A0L7QN34_9HYME|nr:Copia protein [Habropoda laboriosa]
MKDYCVEKGISYHLTVPRTPQLNGVSERIVRTITEKGRTMISGASLNKVFWGEAVLTATYPINLTPTKALKQNKTPLELWHGKRPRVKYLKIFGSTVYIHNKVRKTKFDEKSWKGILVGYELNGYRAEALNFLLTSKFPLPRLPHYATKIVPLKLRRGERRTRGVLPPQLQRLPLVYVTHSVRSYRIVGEPREGKFAREQEVKRL